MQNRPVTLSDLTQDLLWPRLLRVPALALAPGRMLLGAIAVLLIALAFRIPGLWGMGNWVHLVGDRSVEAQQSVLAAPHSALTPRPLLEAASGYVFGVPMRLVREHPWAALASFLPALAVLGVLGGAIARSATLEVATGVRPGTIKSLAFALAKWSSLVGALAAPLILILVIELVLAIGGIALLSLPWVKVVGALSYILALGGGLAVVLLLIGYALGWPMLGAAVVAEGSDGLDSLTRVYAYIWARPLRLLSYLLILAMLLSLTLGVANFVIDRSVIVAAKATGAWLSDASASVLTNPASTMTSSSDKAAAWLVGMWTKVFHVLAAAYTFSFFASGGSVLYLIMRRVCDGQDVSEVWEQSPGA